MVLAVVCQAASEDEKRSLVSVHADADSSPLVGRQPAKELLDDDRGPGDLIHDDCGICFQVAAALGQRGEVRAGQLPSLAQPPGTASPTAATTNKNAPAAMGYPANRRGGTCVGMRSSIPPHAMRIIRTPAATRTPPAMATDRNVSSTEFTLADCSGAALVSVHLIATHPRTPARLHDGCYVSESLSNASRYELLSGRQFAGINELADE